MLVLSNVTGSKIQLTTSAAGAIDVHAAVILRDETLADGVVNAFIVKDKTFAQIVTAVTTDLFTAAADVGSGKKLNVKFLSVRNVHASVDNIITLKHTDGTNTVTLAPVDLAPGEGLMINDAGVLFVYDATGAVKAGAGPGRLLRTQVVTAGTSIITGAGTNAMFARLQGAGGGGGGCTSVASAAAGAGGGGGGSYAEKMFAVTPNTGYTCAIGAAGTGASGAAGNNGGNTTLTVGAVTVTAPGGGGGPQAVAATTLTARAGGNPGAAATSGDLNSSGAPGGYGVTLIVATPILASGPGGNSNFGSGGLGLVAVGNGNNATGFGAGGGGSATGASAVRTGGNGTAGCIIVDEYT